MVELVIDEEVGIEGRKEGRGGRKERIEEKKGKERNQGKKEEKEEERKQGREIVLFFGDYLI